MIIFAPEYQENPISIWSSVIELESKLGSDALVVCSSIIFCTWSIYVVSEVFVTPFCNLFDAGMGDCCLSFSTIEPNDFICCLRLDRHFNSLTDVLGV